MRADRLLSLLMLLQSEGKMTASRLADKLEVSQRTIYRDIDALCSAGVPIYSESGPHGGYDLLDSYRTDLTGLNEREARAFFMLNIPAPLSDLGVGQDLHSALLKLTTALPHSHHKEGNIVRQRFHLDSTWWQQSSQPLPHLQTIEKAVWENQRLIISYQPHYTFELERCVEPYGLVAKAGVWYLVFAQAGRVRALRVSGLRQAMLTEQSFERDPDFSLERFWNKWCEEQESYQANYQVTVRVEEHTIPELLIHFGKHILDQIDNSPPDQCKTFKIQLSFENLQAARERLLSFGSAVEVLEPLALRTSIVDYAKEIVNLYNK